MRPLLLLLLTGGAGAVLWAIASGNRISPETRFAGALEAYERGDVAHVLDARYWLSQDPAFANQVQVLDSAIALSEKRPDRALALLAKLPQDGPLRTEILRLAGEALYDTGRLAEAEVAFRILATEQPESPAARRWLGAIYYNLGADQVAIGELIRLTELEPGDYRPHRLIGLMYLDFKQYADAIPHYEQALELQPPRNVADEIRIELARSYTALHRYDAALDMLAEHLDNASAWAIAAECHWNMGEPDTARDMLAASLEQDPNHREALLLKADILLSEGAIEESADLLALTVAAYPHDAECRYRRALALQQLGRVEESAAEMAAYEEKNLLHVRLTELNLQALREPRNAQIRDELSEVCLALGKTELSQMWRQAAEACRTGSELFSGPPLETASPNP